MQLTVVDACGNTIVCDPVLTDLSSTGKPVEQVLTDLPAAERFVAIRNGAPGLRRLKVIVNGRIYELKGLRDNEQKILNVGPAMLPGNTNRIVLRGLGPAGSSATVVVRDRRR